MRAIIYFFVLIIMNGHSLAQEDLPLEVGPEVNNSSSESLTPANVGNTDENKVEFDFLGPTKTFIQNPFKLRDPFKRLSARKGPHKGKSGELAENQYLKDGVYSNLPSIEGVPIANIKIIGVLLGKDRRAMAKIASGGEKGGTLSDETYILKEGMKLGGEGAELKAILPGGIVLVEKIRNVYDQDEYLETIIPVSTE